MEGISKELELIQRFMRQNETMLNIQQDIKIAQ